jgi:hypothetical protein
MREGDRAPVVAPTATQQKIAQTQTERLAVREPPIDCFAPGVDVVPPTELD